MNIDIKAMYEKGEFSQITDTFRNSPDSFEEEKELLLILKSANKSYESVWELIGNKAVQKTIEYIWNRLMHSDDFEDVYFSSFLIKCIREGRDDLLEDVVLLYLDKHGEMPYFTEYLPYLADNSNKPAVRKYLSMIDAAVDPYLELMTAMISGGNTDPVIKKLDENRGFTQFAFQNSLASGLSSENMKKFISMMKFLPGTFIITQKDIFRITGFDTLRNGFNTQDKSGRKREFPVEKVLLETEAIEGNDFRIYKFFSPEAAKALDPCTLVKLIIRYKGGAVDDNVLKTELLHIYGGEAGKWIIKNRDELAQCEDLDVIFGKICRYMIAEGGGILIHMKRLKDPSKVRDYITEAAGKKTLGDDEIRQIMSEAETYPEPYASEICRLVNTEKDYTDRIKDITLISSIRDKGFKTALLSKFSAESDNRVIDYLAEIDTQGIERIFRECSSSLRQYMLERTERAFALEKDLMLIEWYVTLHADDGLIHFDLYSVIMRTIEIGSNIFMSNKGHEFITFARKAVFQNDGKKLVEIMHRVSREKAEKMHDILFAVNFINEYQRDLIRKRIYDDFPEFRKIQQREYELSTPEGIKRKQGELDDLINRQLPELSVVIQEAAAHGDLKENAEYKYARQQYQFLSGRADELKTEIMKAQPISMEAVSGDKVEPGVIVHIADKVNNTQGKYSILGPLDVAENSDIISYKSPLGEAIMNMKQGDENDKYRIIKIEKYKEI